MPNQGAITDHLPTLFWEVHAAAPRLVVELGVRRGTSTRVLLAAAQPHNASVLSVDIHPSDFTGPSTSWCFMQGRSQDVGRRFTELSAELGLHSQVDVLFIDSSHVYEETLAELESWMPHLTRGGTVIFHDTNMKQIYRTSGGGIGIGWDNERGVSRAIEDFFGLRLLECKNYVDTHGDWVIRHRTHSSGLLVMRQVPRQQAIQDTR